MKRTRPADRRDGWYLLEPLEAQRLLEEQPQNRTLRESKAQRFAKDIEAGKWNPNGEPIILDENDKLLDGQGRCRAVCIAGKPIEVYVVHGVSRRMFTTIDTGQARTGADTCGLAGFKHYAVVSAMVKIAIRSQHATPSTQNYVTNEQVREYSRKNRERIDSSIQSCSDLFSKSPLPASLLCYVHMEASAIDPIKAGRWARSVALGEDLGAGSPILALRERLLKLKGETHKATWYEKLAWAIKSWNAYLAGRRMTLIKWSSRQKGGRSAESFPRFSTGGME